MTEPGQSPADTVIGFAETHLQPLYPWQRDLIRWAFRGDGHQPLMAGGRFIPACSETGEPREHGCDGSVTA